MPGETPLPSHENLHQDLLHLVGREFDLSDTTFYTREGAEAVLRHLDAWLPTKVGSEAKITRTHSVDPPYGQEQSDDDFRSISQTFYWGEIDWETVRTAGVSVEFAGPTQRDKTRHALPAAKPEIITNLEREPLGMEGVKLDALADVRHMPFADGGVGSVHIAALNGAPREFYDHPESDLRDDALHESARTIRPGGYLVWDGGTQQDYDLIVQLGFEPVKLQVTTWVFEALTRPGDDRYFGHELNFSGVFQRLS